MPWIDQLRSANWGGVVGIAVGAYLLGCFATGYYLVRLRTGQDIRELGSGNVGATNVGRALGTRGFVLTFLGDAAKGALAVSLARLLPGPLWLADVAMIAVVAGHIWPIPLRGRGGKGGATTLGALAVLDVSLTLLLLALLG